MSANRAREVPDATPPFLTKELIDLWIGAAEARQKEAMGALKQEVTDQLHAFDRGQLHLIHKVEKLAGDGEIDEGSVVRLEKLVKDYIKENRADIGDLKNGRVTATAYWSMARVIWAFVAGCVIAVLGGGFGALISWALRH